MLCGKNRQNTLKKEKSLNFKVFPIQFNHPGWGARPKVDMSRPSQTEIAYVQTVPDGKCLCPDRPRQKVPKFRLSCVQNFWCVLRAFEVDNFRPKAYMSRLSCVHIQTIVRSSVFPYRVILDARRPLRAFISVWTYRLSVWDLTLGTDLDDILFWNVRWK